jgi:hypothetical protein
MGETGDNKIEKKQQNLIKKQLGEEFNIKKAMNKDIQII